MNDDDVKIAEKMKKAIWNMEYAGWDEEADASRAAIALIERLTAEVERLTPKPLTLKEIAGVFNEHLIHDRDDWDTDGCTVFCRHGDDRIEAGDATLIAYGLLRDAGPSSCTGEQA